jgi:hypothetical protein
MIAPVAFHIPLVPVATLRVALFVELERYLAINFVDICSA